MKRDAEERQVLSPHTGTRTPDLSWKKKRGRLGGKAKKGPGQAVHPYLKAEK